MAMVCSLVVFEHEDRVEPTFGDILAHLRSLIQSEDKFQEVMPMAHGKICYLEIPANRAEDSAEFYSSIFGWKVRPRGDGNLAFDDTGSVSGTWVKESDRTPDEQTRIYIMVDSIVNSLQQIEQAGGKILTPRTDIGPNMGAFAAFADPVGNEFGLYEEPKG
jgi:uncharacterized protein